MQNVLLFVHDDAGQEARISAAIDLVRGLEGHLICLDVAEPVDLDIRAFGGPLVDLVIEQGAAIERHNKASIVPRLARETDEFEWIDSADDPEYAIEQAARLSHLVVLNTRLPATSPLKMSRLLRTLVSRLRAPILAVPPDHTGFNCRGDAVVLWDGSVDAEAALSDATPLLRMARKVTILQVGEHATPPPRKALEYLSSQGISAVPIARTSLGEHPSRKIERYLRTSAPDWAVMGAFGHGRIHDNLFGSVTMHLLANTQTPLLLSRHV